jgi:hypothetical protein
MPEEQAELQGEVARDAKRTEYDESLLEELEVLEELEDYEQHLEQRVQKGPMLMNTVAKLRGGKTEVNPWPFDQDNDEARDPWPFDKKDNDEARNPWAFDQDSKADKKAWSKAWPTDWTAIVAG